MEYRGRPAEGSGLEAGSPAIEPKYNRQREPTRQDGDEWVLNLPREAFWLLAPAFIRNRESILPLDRGKSGMSLPPEDAFITLE